MSLGWAEPPESGNNSRPLTTLLATQEAIHRHVLTQLENQETGLPSTGREGGEGTATCHLRETVRAPLCSWIELSIHSSCMASGLGAGTLQNRGPGLSSRAFSPAQTCEATQGSCRGRGQAPQAATWRPARSTGPSWSTASWPPWPGMTRRLAQDI